MEDGTILLVGATTENPSLRAERGAVLSRAQVLVLERLDDAALEQLLRPRRAGVGRSPAADARGARGPAGRWPMAMGARCLNLVEQVAAWKVDDRCDRRALAHASETARGAIRQVRRRALQPDLGAAQIGARLRPGCGALLVRADAGRRRGPAVTWRGASRGWRSRISAWPTRRRRAICLHAWETYERLGSPEGELALAQAVTYLALAPKSNAGYVAYKAARAAAKRPDPRRRPSIS